MVREHQVNWETVQDLQALLKRTGGTIPASLSRERLCRDLASALTSPALTNPQKYETVCVATQILADLKTSNTASASSCSIVSSLLPALLKVTTVEQCRQKAVSCIQQCLKLCGRNPDRSHPAINSIALHGISDVAIAKTLTNIVPQFIKEIVTNVNHGPIIEALFENLCKPSLEQQTLLALLRYREMLTGDRNFDYYLRTVPNKQRKYFGILCSNLEEFDPKTCKKHAGGKSFGVIPNKIINKLMDKSNGNARGEGSEMLQLEVENCVKIKDIIPFLNTFLTFISGFLEDINSRVINNILYTLMILQRRLPSHMSSHLKLLIRMLLKINSEVKKETKILIYQNVNQLMSNSGCQLVVDELSEFSSDKSWRVREEVLNLLSLSLLTYPSSDLDLDTISQTAGGALTDGKRRVRQAGMECLAVAAQCLGHHRVQLLMDYLGHLDRKEKAGGEMVRAVRARLARKCLPRLSSGGLVEYGVDTANTTTSQHGPDMDWILAGSAGSLLDVQSQSRRSRADSGSGLGKPRTPSLPPMGNRPDLGTVAKIRSTREHRQFYITLEL